MKMEVVKDGHFAEEFEKLEKDPEYVAECKRLEEQEKTKAPLPKRKGKQR